MIRRILFFIAIIYTGLWFTGAYLIKEKVVHLVNGLGSDNIKVSFADVKISGFPGNWAINLMAPKLTFINHIDHKEISFQKLVFIINFSFRKSIVVFDGQIIQKQSSKDGTAEYVLNSGQPLKVILKFNKPLYAAVNQENLFDIVKDMKFDNDIIKINYQNDDILTIDNITVGINKTGTVEREVTWVKFAVTYRGSSKVWDFGAANLNFDVIFTNNPYSSFSDNYKTWYNDVEVKGLSFTLDDAKVYVKGAMQFPREQLPQGKFSIVLANYRDIIDKLWPQEFFISKLRIKELVEKVADNLDYTKQEAAFDIEISGQGIRVGSINLLE